MKELNIVTTEASIMITQKADCNSSDDQCLTLTLEDGGGGSFYTIDTERWAFDSAEELMESIAAMANLVKELKI